MLSIGISGIYNGFNTNTGIYGYAAKAGRGPQALRTRAAG